MYITYLLFFTTFFPIPRIFHKLNKCKVQEYPKDEIRLQCCAKRLACCDQKPAPTKFEIKALLLSCSKPPDKCDDNMRPVFRNTKSKPTTKLTCKRKISVTIKLKNEGVTNTNEQLIFIDHVYDDVTDQQQRLFRPYVIKIKQDPVVQSYNLLYENPVNSEVTEVVLNKDTPGFMGCSVDPDNPTCQVVSYNGGIIPFSTGFCCSCDDKVNAAREEYDSKCDNFECSENLDDVDNVIPKPCMEQNPGSISKSCQKIQLHKVNKRETTTDRPGTTPEKKEEVKPSSCQTRGGQDCSTHPCPPPGADPETYMESAHCLEFSDTWYSVYKITRAKIKHSVEVEVFEKHEEIQGGTHFKDLSTHDRMHIDSDTTDILFNDEKTISIQYRKMDTGAFALNPGTEKILVPDDKASPGSENDPEKYMVLEKSQLSRDGKVCDVAGVGYEAFFRQPSRCERPRGTCLKNQPAQLYQKDCEAESKGLKGCYFLKFYGVIAEDFKENCKNDNTNLTIDMYFTDTYTSQMKLEFKADDNVVLRTDMRAIITEVYTDSTTETSINIVVKVTNSGVTPSILSVALSNCPVSVPASFNNLKTKPALLAPQHQHIFHIDIAYTFSVKGFTCSAEVLNAKEKVIALRKISIKSKDRCFCLWYCSCTCLNNDKTLKCSILSIQDYNIAGFQGGFRKPYHVVKYTFLDDMISMMLYIILFLCLFLLLLGLIKALLGVFVNINIGLWGLDVILDLPKPMKQYYESSISCRKVRYDSYGWPIHPDTCKRVRNIAIPTEFCLNIVFFIIFPFSVCCVIIKRFFSSKYDERNEYGTQTQSDSSYCKCT